VLLVVDDEVRVCERVRGKTGEVTNLDDDSGVVATTVTMTREEVAVGE